jgi:hypothetical protein
MAARLQLIGQTFGRLTVIGNAPNYVSPGGQRHSQWLCRCECGTEKAIRGSELRKGAVQSCGCWNSEVTTRRNTTHGMAKRGQRNRAYEAWAGMLQRCTNPNDKEWRNYGQRGIRVCDAWQAFEAFYADMGNPPKGTSLDRVDVNGGYCPENCRWATSAEQARNKRTNVWVEYEGQRMVLEDACEMAGISRATVYSRMKAGRPESEWFRPVKGSAAWWAGQMLES